MELTPRQKMLASQVRTLFDPTVFSEIGTAHTFSDTMACVFDGLATGIHPDEMFKHLGLAMHCYCRLMANEHKTALEDICGKQKAALILRHDNADIILHRIFKRVGEMTPGKDVSGINVEDILAEEMGMN